MNIPCIICDADVPIKTKFVEDLIRGGRGIMCKNCVRVFGDRGGFWEDRGYDKYLKSPDWKSKSDACKERDGNRCRLCNSPERLEAHHRTYERIYHEWPEDLTTLCHDCHEWYSLWQKSKDNGRKSVLLTPPNFSLD